MRRYQTVNSFLFAAIAFGLFVACGGGGGGGGLTFPEPAYFVSIDDPSASDANPGSPNLPYKNLPDSGVTR